MPGGITTGRRRRTSNCSPGPATPRAMRSMGSRGGGSAVAHGAGRRKTGRRGQDTSDASALVQDGQPAYARDFVRATRHELRSEAGVGERVAADCGLRRTARTAQDVPISIGHGQVTTQPSLSAMMISGLDLSRDAHVLEIGTGLGFQTALLAQPAADVVTTEMWPDIALQARRNRARQDVRNVELRVGDGSGGVPDVRRGHRVRRVPGGSCADGRATASRRPPRTAHRARRPGAGRVLPYAPPAVVVVPQ